MGSIDVDSQTSVHDRVFFDASKHLSYEPPTKVISLADISLPQSAISPVASSVPFPLLSQDAILQHRKELFSKDVIDNCMYHTREGSVQLRGMAPRYAPFIHDFWTSPEVLGIISKIAGVDLIPVMDYEICHTNVQLGPEGVAGVSKIPVTPLETTDAEIENFHKMSRKEGSKDFLPVVPWHRDSHPFVCVVMLSCAEYMTDGETELRKGDGTTIKVKSPQIGHAVVLQGRSVSHIAIPAGNMPERITIVTSFRPRDVRLLDDSSNMNVRTKSQLSELYYQWTGYRLRLLSERFRLMADELKKSYDKNITEKDPEGKAGYCKKDTVDVEQLTEWMNLQKEYMENTVFEMRPVTKEDNYSKDTTARAA